jgi:hypothetical protein
MLNIAKQNSKPKMFQKACFLMKFSGTTRTRPFEWKTTDTEPITPAETKVGSDQLEKHT